MSQACFQTARRGLRGAKRSGVNLRRPAEAFRSSDPEPHSNGGKFLSRAGLAASLRRNGDRAMAGEIEPRQAIGTRTAESPIPARAGNPTPAAIPGHHP